MLISGKTVHDASINGKRVFEFAMYNKPFLRVYYENNKRFFSFVTCKKGILNVSKTEKRVYFTLQNHKLLFLQCSHTKPLVAMITYHKYPATAVYIQVKQSDFESLYDLTPDFV